jgi:phosphate:Na+ symporter
MKCSSKIWSRFFQIFLNEINNYRNQLKNQNILDVNNKEYDYQMGVYYMDIIAECEKLGDYVVNVVEASSDIKEKKAS